MAYSGIARQPPGGAAGVNAPRPRASSAPPPSSTAIGSSAGHVGAHQNDRDGQAARPAARRRRPRSSPRRSPRATRPGTETSSVRPCSLGSRKLPSTWSIAIRPATTTAAQPEPELHKRQQRRQRHRHDRADVGQIVEEEDQHRPERREIDAHQPQPAALGERGDQAHQGADQDEPADLVGDRGRRSRAPPRYAAGATPPRSCAARPTPRSASEREEEDEQPGTPAPLPPR